MAIETFPPVVAQLLDAAYNREVEALAALEPEVQQFYLSLVARFQSNTPLLAGQEQYTELQRALEQFFPHYSSSLKSLLAVNEQQTDEELDLLCSEHHTLEITLQALQEKCQLMELELPELLDHHLLNQLMTLLLHQLHGHLVGPQGLAPRLPALMEFLEKSETARSNFFSRFQEPELKAEFDKALEQMKQAAGGLFHITQNQAQIQEISQTADLLQRGGKMLCLCLAQMQDLEAELAEFSVDPLLERLHRHRSEPGTFDRLWAELAKREQERSGEFQALTEQRLYYHSDPDELLEPLHHTWEALENLLSAKPSPDRLEEVRQALSDYDAALDEVYEQLEEEKVCPSEKFAEYFELMQAIAQGRSPMYLLTLHTEGLWDSLQALDDHLERSGSEDEVEAPLETIKRGIELVESFLEEPDFALLQQAYQTLFDGAEALSEVAEQPAQLEENAGGSNPGGLLETTQRMLAGSLSTDDGRSLLKKGLERHKHYRQKLAAQAEKMDDDLPTDSLEALLRLEGDIEELLGGQLDNNLLLRLESTVMDMQEALHCWSEDLESHLNDYVS